MGWGAWDGKLEFIFIYVFKADPWLVCPRLKFSLGGGVNFDCIACIFFQCSQYTEFTIYMLLSTLTTKAHNGMR